VIVDQTGWAKLHVTGADAARFLGGMLTSDVAKLAVGGQSRAVMLSVKGRVMVLLEAYREADGFLLVTEAPWGDKLHQLLDKHAIADDVTFARVDRPLHRVWDSPAAVWQAPMIFAPPPGTPASEAELEIARVEAGLPRYGVDVTEDHFPFEANLEGAIAFDKGCYLGQEVVVRATTRGAAKKKLVGLRLAGPAAEGDRVFAPATEGGEDCGVITSAVISPTYGPIALAYVHHTRWALGTTLVAHEHVATVSELPFAVASAVA
jgi:folate-binding protein YgfZ